MNDREAAELLAGIDAPRSMPRGLADAVLAELTDPTVALRDEARPLPDDLRRRLEASLLAAHPMPLPGRVRRRIEDRLAGADRPLSRIGAAAAAVLLVIGVLAAVTSGDGGGPSEVATPSTTVTRPGASEGTSSGPVPAPVAGAGDAGTSAGGSGGGSGSGGASAGSAPPPPFSESDTADGSPAAAPGSGASAGGGGGPLLVRLAGPSSDVHVAIVAYFDVVNAAGGIRGRRIEVDDGQAAGAVAVVNIGEESLTTTPEGVVFETVQAEESRLAGRIASLASAIEHQARLAAAAAFPDGGGSAAIYVGPREPWLTVVPSAMEVVLRERGVASVRVPYNGRAAADPGSDAIFLSLDSDLVGAWLEDYTGAAPPRGTWGVASAWDDDLAAKGASVGLRSVSPYTRAGGDEEAALAAEISLSAPAVHGWVTGKAIAHLLYESGGAPLTEASLDSLVGWDSGWAPPFAVRDGTRSRTPDGIVLVADGTRFVPTGGFLTDD